MRLHVCGRTAAATSNIGETRKMTSTATTIEIPGYRAGTWNDRHRAQRGRLQHPPPHDQQGEGQVRALRRDLRDRREPARLDRDRVGRGRLDHDERAEPRRAPAHRRLLRGRVAPDDRLRLDRRARRGRRLQGRRRPHDPRHHQARDLRLRLRRLRRRPLRQLQGRRHREDRHQPRGLRPHATTRRSRRAACCSATR